MNVKQTTDEPKVLPQDTLEGVDEDEWVSKVHSNFALRNKLKEGRRGGEGERRGGERERGGEGEGGEGTRGEGEGRGGEGERRGEGREGEGTRGVGEGRGRERRGEGEGEESRGREGRERRGCCGLRHSCSLDLLFLHSFVEGGKVLTQLHAVTASLVPMSCIHFTSLQYIIAPCMRA